jgi:glyoxylase I family protein
MNQPQKISVQLQSVHHIAIICSNYVVSKKFYTEVLGFSIVKETYRAERDSYKLDLAINGDYIIELFSFPNPPARPSQPESCGLRHLAFSVKNIEATLEALASNGVVCEPIRIDTLTNKRFTFFADPDGLPLELYEV